MQPEKDPLQTNAPMAEQQNSPAAELGLVDGQFPVVRSGGEVDYGWRVTGHREVIDPKTGLPETAVFIEKPMPREDDPNNVGTRSVRLSDIQKLSQETQGLEDTVRRGNAISLFGETAAVASVEIEEVATERAETKTAELMETYGERNVKLFAPVQVESGNKVESTKEDTYDHLFSDDYALDTYGVEGAEQRKIMGRGIATEASEQFTMTEVLSRFSEAGDLHGSNVAAIIKQYLKPGVQLGSRQAMEEIRNNLELRLELGNLFIARQEHNKDMLPQRVKANMDKATNAPGYKELADALGKIKAREYVALLCLARLDGTFDPDASISDPVIATPDGTIIRGQHRAASDLILFY